jgi:hypothetical protein
MRRLSAPLACVALALAAMAGAWAAAAPVIQQHPTSAPTTNPNEIGARLDEAKATHEKQVAAARRALVAAITGRLNAAADAGNLAQVESFQAAKTKASVDGSLPPDIKDVTILGAHAQMERAIEASNSQLAAAYREAIVRYTKARNFTEAEATRDELARSGLATAGSHDDLQGAQISSLSAALPSFLIARQPYARGHDGVRVMAPMVTRAANFLDKDFTFDVWFTQEHADEAEAVMIGIGGAGDPDSDDHTCVSLVIDPPSDRGSKITVNTERWEGREVGVIHPEGMCMARLQKRGDQIVFSVGVEANGKFSPDASAAVASIRELDKTLNSRNTHLFFGHRHTRGAGDGRVTFNKVRLAMGAPPAPSDEQAPGAPSGSSNLASALPSYFAPGEPYATNKDGIRIDDFIKTKDADFLDKDFTFDVSFILAEDDEAEGVMLGIGGTGNPDSDDDTCLSLVIETPRGSRREVSVNTSQWKGKRAGDVHGNGPFVARIEKKGNQVNFSVGVEVNGKFMPDVSSTVADIRQLKPNFNSRNTHLFFGHRHTRGRGDGRVTFTQTRLVIDKK